MDRTPASSADDDSSQTHTAEEPKPGSFLPLLSSEREGRRHQGLFQWLFAGGRLDFHADHEVKTHPWYLVLWLTGVDYFSTLGYQPGIALLAAGALSPIATAILIAVTLCCALPVYAQVAGRSFVGQGSIAMLENLLAGWWGRILVLVLLGFAATDFVITMTLSAADAAQHAIENPYLHPYLGDARMTITIGLLALLALVFLKGFSEAIGLAAVVAIPYLALNLVILGACLLEIAHHPTLMNDWKSALTMRGDWTALIIAATLIFPRLALGLSGFETGVSVMPLISGSPDDIPAKPKGRIRNTRKLLAAAAAIMSVLLLISSFVTTLLIPPAVYQTGGKASGRAIAYLAHLKLGSTFGTLYDVSTILILWFAGASAMAGLLHLIPRYLPRLGMAPLWVAYPRPLVLVLFAVNVVITIVFRADVEAQGGAYATGVLVLMLSAAIAAALALWQESKRLLSIYCSGVSIIFAYTLVDNVIERPDGIVIASVFIFITMVVSAVSRYLRATELRVSAMTFVDAESAELWAGITAKKVNLVPVRTASEDQCHCKRNEIRNHYNVRGSLAFVNVNLIDNRSEFFAPLQVRVTRTGEDYIIEVSQAIAIANTIAYISEMLDPISIFLGLTRLNPMNQALRYLLFGEGETGIMVYTILLRYWAWTPEDDVRPLIFIMSD
ncbi:MAG TPA: hypothetical protein VMZ52_17840 [Bryobacteraceae bacterium]|nr:hypothetical protein [Bryobacteraceae bacterium]